MPTTTRQDVLEIIRRKGRGAVVTRCDFPATLDPVEVNKVLNGLHHVGRLKKIGKGVFHFPRKIVGLDTEVPPEPMKVAKAFAKLKGHRLAPSGAAAANSLGLSAQVPVKTVFVTDGPNRTIHFGNLAVVIRHVAPRTLRVGGGLERAIVQAILHLGPNGVDDQVLRKLRSIIPPARRPRVLAASKRVGGWVGGVLQRAATPDGVGNG